MKKLVNFSVALLLIFGTTQLTGCQEDENNEYPDVTAIADTIFGTLKYKKIENDVTTIVSWPFGAATFRVVAEVDQVLATAPVNADGTFMLILPATVSGSYLYSLADVAVQEGGTVVCTPQTVRYLGFFQYLVDYSDNGTPQNLSTTLCTLKSDSSLDRSYFYNFYDSDGTLAGTSSKGDLYDWTYTKGWGMVELKRTGALLATFESKSINTAPANAVWVNL